jgi:hypothetical protein
LQIIERWVRDATGQTFRAWRARAAELKRVLSKVFTDREREGERDRETERECARARA